MHFRQKLTFMALGSILTLAGYLLATFASDVTAQPETDKTTVFDKIVCRELEVVDADGEGLVWIGEISSSAFMTVQHPDGEHRAIIMATSDSASMAVGIPGKQQSVSILAGLNEANILVGHPNKQQSVLITARPDSAAMGVSAPR